MNKRLIFIQESKKGKRIEELIKGSLDYKLYEISQAFRMQFPNDETHYYYVSEAFDDHVLISCGGSELKVDEMYSVNYTREGDAITFAPRDQWQVVQNTVQPVQAMMESRVSLAESEGNTRRIRIERLMTAGKVNGNKRRYSADVLKAAVDELKGHLHESAGQGRLMVLGEVEHPNDKGTRRASLLETVIRWDAVEFDGRYVNATGLLATATDAGRHIQALAEIGIAPGGSIRGYGQTESVKAGSGTIDEVTELHITGIDLVSDPSFDDSQSILESVGETDTEAKMNLLEKLLALLKSHPDALKGITEAQLRAMDEKQLQELNESIRVTLNIPVNVEIGESLKANAEKARQYDEAEKKTRIDKAISEATKELPYGEDGNQAFIVAIQNANPQDEAAVKSLVEAKRKEYDAIFSKVKLGRMGFKGSGISHVAPVLETETGTPEFARTSFQLVESIRKVDLLPVRDWKKAETRGELFTRQLLERFDKLYQNKLMAEARELEEAETTADLNLPYTVSRAIIEEAFPNLVASGLFDVGIMNNSPERLYFEHYTGETGYSGTATAEVTTADLGEWVQLDFGRITPGTFVLTNSDANVTYTENSDYVVDYATGRYKALATITDNQSLKATYDYTAIRKGEMQPIERAKITLDFKVIEAAADRLADQISREAIVFSQSQLGLDVVARTLANLIKQQRRKVDQGLLYMALAQVHSVSNNEAGVWTPGTDQADYAELVRLIGKAKVKVSNRFYEPTYILCSQTNADVLSNWDGFTRLGFPNAVLNAAGFAGGVKGLPIFASTEFPDTKIVVGNNQLVMYRVYQPLQVRGPYQTYHTDGKLIAADQYYTEQFDATESPIAEKGSYVTISEEAS